MSLSDHEEQQPTTITQNASLSLTYHSNFPVPTPMKCKGDKVATGNSSVNSGKIMKSPQGLIKGIKKFVSQRCVRLWEKIVYKSLTI